jgi:hypothetical protein
MIEKERVVAYVDGFKVHDRFPQKRVLVVFPPNRHNVSMKNVAKGHFIIGKQKLKQSQFSHSLVLANGYVMEIPTEWKQ